MLRISKKVVRFLFVVIALTSVSSASLISVGFGYLTPADVTVDARTQIGTNRFSVAFKLDYEWKRWRDSSVLRQLAKDANFKLVAFSTWKSDSPRACTYWYESTQTGTFDWTNVDSLVRRIFELGAEPFVILGGYDMSSQFRPKGMATNPATGLPYPSSWAAYSAQWVKHFKAVGLPVKYYEINTEGFKYFGWNAAYGLTKLQNYINVWNAAARAMRAVDPTIRISDDSITMPKVFDYWLTHGDDVDFLDFHKYDSYSFVPGTSGYYTSAQLLSMADTRCYVTSSNFYGIDDARQKWMNARGKFLPVINSETNLDSAWSSGTDIRIQQMVGAVWTALMLRVSVFEGLDYSVYFQFASSAHYTSVGDGFGMVNTDNNQPWYPYYVNKLFGSNLGIGDSLLSTTSTSSDLRTLAWIHGTKLNVLLIHKVDQARTVNLHGLQGQFNFSKIDNTISWQTPSVQKGVIDASKPLTLNGYTILLLQSNISTPPPTSTTIFQDGFESGDFYQWNGTLYTAGETGTVTGARSYSGINSARFTSDGSGGVERAYVFSSISSVPEIYIRAQVYISAGMPLVHDGDRFNIIAASAAVGGGVISSVSVQRSGGVDKWAIRSPVGTWFASSGPSMGQWYAVEFYVKIGVTDGIVRLWVNEQKVIERTSLNTAGQGDIGSVRFGLPFIYGVTGSVYLYGDSFTLSSSHISP